MQRTAVLAWCRTRAALAVLRFRPQVRVAHKTSCAMRAINRLRLQHRIRGASGGGCTCGVHEREGSSVHMWWLKPFPVMVCTATCTRHERQGAYKWR